MLAASVGERVVSHPLEATALAVVAQDVEEAVDAHRADRDTLRGRTGVPSTLVSRTALKDVRVDDATTRAQDA